LELGFWFIQTAVLFYILFKVNEGELRIYVFLACLLGYRDRKSTRLNSSHVSISYAVFCLKKKRIFKLATWKQRERRTDASAGGSPQRSPADRAETPTGDPAHPAS